MNESTHDGNKWFVLVSVWLSLALAALLVAGVWLFVKAQPRLLTLQIREAAFAGEYDKAVSCIEQLIMKDESMAIDATLSAAEIADYRNDWEIATQLVETYASEDVAELSTEQEEKARRVLQQCAYHQAMSLYEEGSYAKASAAAAAIKDYEPAQRLYQLSYQALVASQPTPEPTVAPTQTPEPMQTIAANAEVNTIEETPAVLPTVTPEPVRKPLAEGRVAAGYHHTVFLRDDGTVFAYGDDTYGQTDVSHWQNIVAVAAGAYHTVGLTADGRVLTAGDNSQGQCEVGLYTDVKQIAASAWDTCMLLKNGQVVTVGFHQYDFAMELFPAESIAAGSYGLLVRCQGTNHASHGSMQLDSSCVQFALSRGYAIGLDREGRVHSSIDGIPEWENIVAVSAGDNAALALSEDGSIYSYVFDKHLKCTFDFAQPVLAISAGANHYAFVLQDGSLEIRYSDGSILVPDEKLW